jgi:membrane protease YdiL (CAAX protease family)
VTGAAASRGRLGSSLSLARASLARPDFATSPGVRSGADRFSRTSEVALLALAFGGAVVVRVAVAGPAGAGSISAGLVFAAVLTVLAVRRVAAPRFGVAAIGIGLAGAAVLLLPVVVTATGRGITSAGGGAAYLSWGLATAVVATAEEAFLRGALFDALQRWRGSDVAVLGAAVAFAALHVPLYGWHVVPLDLAVGLGLGGLRLAAGTWTAPAIAHVGADLAGWWFV